MKRELIKRLAGGDKTGQNITVCAGSAPAETQKRVFPLSRSTTASCFGNLQLLAPSSLENYAEIVKKVFPGCSLKARGVLTESPGAGQAFELKCDEIEIIGECDPEIYPLQKQRVSFEKLREIAHLRPRTNTFGAVIRLRNSLARAVHKFFQDRDFYYINTPIITASDCEGAGQMFQATTINMQNPPKDKSGQIDFSQDFFGKKAHLTVSGQLEGETCACAMGNIYTFGPTFRAENSTTRRHLAEF